MVAKRIQVERRRQRADTQRQLCASIDECQTSTAHRNGLQGCEPKYVCHGDGYEP